MILCNLSAYMCDWSLGAHNVYAFNFILKIGCDTDLACLWCRLCLCMAMRSCKMLIVDIEHDDRAKRAMNKIIAGKYFTFHISIASD